MIKIDAFEKYGNIKNEDEFVERVELKDIIKFINDNHDIFGYIEYIDDVLDNYNMNIDEFIDSEYMDAFKNGRLYWNDYIVLRGAYGKIYSIPMEIEEIFYRIEIYNDIKITQILYKIN